MVRRSARRHLAPSKKRGKDPEPKGPASTPVIEPTLVRLGILGLLVIIAFGALFSRLWFLQVLASEDYRVLARENRVRRVQSEPPRGRILDRNGKVLVGNRLSLSVTIDRQSLRGPRQQRRVLERLERVLDRPRSDLRSNLLNPAVSPYKPVPVANDVSRKDVTYLAENQEDFPGVGYELLPVRTYPEGPLAAHVLGYVGQISEEELKAPYFRSARPRYLGGDLIGKAGIERTYDRYLRGRPQMEKVIVNSGGEVTDRSVIRPEEPGRDLTLTLDAKIQRLSEKALASGIRAARAANYQAIGGGVTVMDPRTGGVVAMASYPTYDPGVLADGISTKEYGALGAATPNDPTDDKLLNRALQGQRPPGSTFKVVTAGAAMASGVASSSSYLGCPPSFTYGVTFNNWTSADMGSMGFARSLEVSCDTFYYALGARMEDTFGAKEPFQKYARRAGFGHVTGIDLPNEAAGRVPDRAWCNAIRKATDGAICPYGWVPGYTINMSTGQGDLIVTPLQMATTYAAIANGGKVWKPYLGSRLSVPGASGEGRVVRRFDTRVTARLPLEADELGVIRQGLVQVISGASGTAAGAFAGFPLDEFPLSGKTGTAELSATDSSLNDAWFLSYGPARSPKYVISVYVERAGHGGESAAPIAREIWEGIGGFNSTTDVTLARDSSG
ncbi:MAG: penicillin-binding protein 2 [Actinobacteria bacterium]|nr:penicillin-binding protein 2 [Actinomycetota bacterium]